MSDYDFRLKQTHEENQRLRLNEAHKDREIDRFREENEKIKAQLEKMKQNQKVLFSQVQSMAMEEE